MNKIFTLLSLAAVALSMSAAGEVAPLSRKSAPKGFPHEKAAKPERIVEDGWHSVGKGVWYEGLLTIFDEIDYDLSWEIDVEESDEKSGYYRFIPYCEGSPVAEIVGAPDTEYFYLDASDPEKVYSEEFIAYREFEYNYYFSQRVPENLWDDEMYGKVIDGTVYFPAESFGYFAPETSSFWPVNFEGDFKIVLPGGTPHDNWTKISETTFTDGFVGPYFEGEARTAKVTVEERYLRPGYYRIKGVFASMGSDAPLIIDATNPDFVVVPSQSTGLQHPERGETYVYSHCENFISPTKCPTWQDYAETYPQYVATLRDGLITFPPDAIVLHFPDWNPLSFTTNDENARQSSVYVGKETGIGEISPATDSAEPEYYTLQGLRVQRPGKGLYIVRQGDTVKKIIF